MPEISTAMAIKTTNLVKSFGALRAVDDLSLSIYQGEVFGFLGPNGAGKTTAIKMLCGLLKPDGGNIQIDAKRKYQSIGFCPQDIIIWENLTCIEQLFFMGKMYDLPHSVSKARAVELLDAFGLTLKMNSLAKNLSGGMQRRLNIALALIHNPDILILDEPQAGLDPQSRVLVREYIQSIKSKVTIILTTHDMEEAEKLSDRICIIDHGKSLVTGTVDEIKRKIGGGDIFEIEIIGNAIVDLLPHLRSSVSGLKSEEPGKLTFIADNAQTTLTEIMSVIETRKIVLLNFRMRGTSLEDVFINLTGRGLRE